MRAPVSDVCVRARGMATRLLGTEELGRLAHLPGSGALARELEALGHAVAAEAGPHATQRIDRAVSRSAGRRLALLARWLGERANVFAAVFEEEEQLAIRTLLRSAGQGLPPAARRSGAIASPHLSESALDLLAKTESVTDLVSTLARSGSPYGAVLRTAQRAGRGLRGLETALRRAFAARARSAARAGAPELGEYASESIDLENAWSALLAPAPSAASGEVEALVDDFLEGGLWISRDRYQSVLHEASAPARRARLDRLLARTAFATVFSDTSAPSSVLEARALRERIAGWRRRARRDPIGAAPILEFALRLRAEVRDLRRIAWGIESGAPPRRILRELVT